MISKEKIYEGIADVKDESTRNILYIQFIQLHFPKCYELIAGEKLKGGSVNKWIKN